MLTCTAPGPLPPAMGATERCTACESADSIALAGAPASGGGTLVLHLSTASPNTSACALRAWLAPQSLSSNGLSAVRSSKGVHERLAS